MEITMQQMFDSIVSLTPEQSVMIRDMENIEQKYIEDIREHGYTEDVLKAWDKVAEDFGLSFTHRKLNAVPLTTVGDRPTIH